MRKRTRKRKSANQFLKNKIKTGWPISCLVFLLACNTNASYRDFKPTHADSVKYDRKIDNAFKTIRSFSNLVQTGDIITRTGNDFTSYGLRTLNRRDKTYSHCGIASIENDSIFVYHALGGEFNPDQKLLRQTFAEFSEPFSNNGIAIYRFSDLSIGKKAALNAREFYTRELPFDMDFDMATDDRMYCAEFVVKALEKSSDTLRFNRSRIGAFEFAGVDDIFLHPGISAIASTVYK